MSIKVMSHVWTHSKQRGSYLVTMLAIADYAHDDGKNAYPSIATLAKKTRMTERNVQLVLRKLVDDEELVIEFNAGPHGCNRYAIPLDLPDEPPDPDEGENLSGPPPASVKKDEGKPVTGVQNPVSVEHEITPNPLKDPSD